jgi:phosphate-selective porin OprO and OprP
MREQWGRRTARGVVSGILFGILLTTASADDFSDLIQSSHIEPFAELKLAQAAVDEAPMPPPPAPPVEESLDDVHSRLQEQRLSNLEMEFHRLENRFMSGDLVPGRPRSTDIAPVPPPSKTPTFPNTRLTGFFQADAAWFAQDTGSTAEFGNIQDDRGFRRARLAAVGDVAKNVSYMIEMDFAFPGRPSFMDVWVDVHEVPLFGNVRIGQWRQPFGLDELTSVRELTFLERPTGFAFAPFRQTGIGFHNNNEDQTVTWAASVYGFPTDAFGDSLGDKGYGTAERITGLLLDDDCDHRVLHVGAGHVLTVPNNAGASYRNTPEYGGPFGGPAGNVGDVPFFVNTGVLNYDSANLLNAELAGVYQSFHWQSEARYAIVDIGGDTIALPSAYVQGAYLLTGEVRPYNRQAAVLGRIKPLRPWGDCGGCGAWELAARYSYINLNPAAPFSAGGAGLLAGQPPGGALNDVTLGLNWYLNANLKFQFNYIRAMLNVADMESSTDIVAFRTQLDF